MTSSPKTPIIKNPPPKAPIGFRINTKGEPDTDPYHASRSGYHYEYDNPIKEGNLRVLCSSAPVSPSHESPSSISYGSFSAIAFKTDSGCDSVGITYGACNYNKLENLEIYAVRQGLNLERKIRQLGLHNGTAHVTSCMAFPPNVFAEIEMRSQFSDLCFAEDDAACRRTHHTYVGDELKNAPPHILGLLAQMKEAAASAAAAVLQ